MHLCTLRFTVIVKALYQIQPDDLVSETNSKFCFKSFTRTISLEFHCLINLLTKVWFHNPCIGDIDAEGIIGT